MKLQMADGTLKPLMCNRCNSDNLVLVGGRWIDCISCSNSKSVQAILKNQKAVRVML